MAKWLPHVKQLSCDTLVAPVHDAMKSFFTKGYTFSEMTHTNSTNNDKNISVVHGIHPKKQNPLHKEQYSILSQAKRFTKK